jgi:hypothetical protein
VNNGIGMIINGLVAILLVLTIGYCMLLNRRLKLLKSDEHSLRATISELVTATDIAERAIAGLKLTVEECEVELEARLARGERLTADLDRRIVAGKSVLERLAHAAAGDSASAERLEAPAGQRRSETKASAHDVQAVAAGGAGLCREVADEGAWSRRMIRFIRDLRLLPIALIASARLPAPRRPTSCSTAAAT